MITLRDGGADVVLCASNPLSTQDDVAAALVRDYSIPVFAIKGEDNETYYKHIMAALDHKPHITMDDGADLVTTALTKRHGCAGRHPRRHGRNHYRRHSPARHGQGRRAALPHHRRERRRHQAPVRQPLRHRTIHASTASSAPPTSCWRDPSSSSPAMAGADAGLASRARGLGADVIVTEIDPTKALEAVMDGFRVMSMDGRGQDRRHFLHRDRQQERPRAKNISR